MRAKDLMMGDYISIKPSGMPIKIAAVHHKKVAYHATINKLTWIRESLLEPIPLTPKVLEKNGFETQPNIGYIIDDWDGTQIIYDSWNYNLRIIKNYKVCLDIEIFDNIAVHELQHALRLCGIEKEIVL